MIRERALRKREKLLGKLPVTGELLRGSLLERTIRHTKDCPKCARDEGHHVFVLTVTYPGGRTRQFSVRRERVDEVRHSLANYQKLKEAIEAFVNSIMTCCVRIRRPRSPGAKHMIEMRRAQRSFGDGLITAEVEDLREDWMAQADRVLADEALVAAVYEALGQRHPKSKSRGRQGTPAEVVWRLLLLKHIRNWSYEVLEREVRANLVYRDFTRVGAGKTPDAKTMGRWGLALGAAVIKQIHTRMVTLAQSHGLTEGRRMRVDTTVVETNIHYPTDASLLGDGVRVLTRAMKTITKIVGEVGTKLRDRSRSVKRRVLDIARAARSKAKQGQEKLKRAYGQLLNSTSRVVGQAKRFASEITVGVKRSAAVVQQLALEGLRDKLNAMVPLVRQVMQQTRARILRGDRRSDGKLVSLFEPSTEIIRKGKAGKPTEFGKMIKLQEAENQIVTDYEVYDRRPNDADLLIPAVDTHHARLGRVPHLVAADAAFYSAKNEAAAKAKGVKRVCIPNRSTKSPERRREQKKGWFGPARRGAPAARAASAWSNAAMASTAAATKAMPACSAGSASASSPTTSSPSAAPSQSSRQQRRSAHSMSRPQIPLAIWRALLSVAPSTKISDNINFAPESS